MGSGYRKALTLVALAKASVLCGVVSAALLGCSSPPPEKSDEDIEKARQQHINTMQREAEGIKR
jgi:outer membrane biogenesis lipoprotein LolB